MIRFGIKSGCDAFFMPKDITARMLAAHESDREFRRNAGGAPRKDVESGKLKIVQAGDGSVHPIEAKYLAPEVHSLMKVDRPVVRAADLDRVVLLVGEPMEKLKTKSPWVWRYIQYGMTANFVSEQVKARADSETIDLRRPRPVVRSDRACASRHRVLADGPAVPPHYRRPIRCG